MSFSGHALGSLWTQMPALMGVVNVTPDSFSDGGKFYSTDKAIEHGVTLISEGADIIDVGGESTRPGAQEIDSQEEMQRVLPVVKALAGRTKYLSIDTRHADVMEAALAEGANIINDISALRDDPRAIAVAKAAKVPVILMHKQGSPKSMQKNPSYENVVEEVFQYLQERIHACETNRIDENLIVIDPGIGFGKSLEHNILLLRNLRKFSALNAPLMVGLSRKSFIGKLSEGEPANDRIPGSLSAALWSYAQGVHILRVHDVKETRQALKIFQAISSAG